MRSALPDCEVVEDTLSDMGTMPADTLEDVLEADRKAREVSAQIILKRSKEHK